MLTWLRSWQGGCTIAAACLVIGLVRVAGGVHDLLTVASFALAACYAFAAAVERRASNTRRATRPDRADPMPWAREPSRLTAWLTAEQGYALDPGAPAEPVRPRVAVLTRDRVGAALAIAAAVIGLALVLHDHGSRDRDSPTAASSSLSGR